jgi:hypothetical protein
MQFLNKIGILVSVGFIMSGCSAHEITVNDLKANQQIESSISSCYQAQGNKALAQANQLAQIPANQKALVLMFTMQGDQITSAVAAATGHSVDPCKQTTVFDAQIAEVKSKNAALTKGLGTLGTAVKWGAGVWGVSEVMDTVSGASTIINGDNAVVDSNKASNGSSVVSDNALNGDNATISPTAGMTNSADETHVANTNTNSDGNDNTVTIDKHKENANPAPEVEEPEVEEPPAEEPPAEEPPPEIIEE